MASQRPSPSAGAPSSRMNSSTTHPPRWAPSPPPPPTPISDNLDARQIYDASKNAVTYIVADTPEGQATGSGFVVSKDGLIVTNDHVVDGASQVQVKIGTSNQAQDATVVGADPSRDLALLKVDANNLPTLSLGRLLVGRRGRSHVRHRQPLRPRPHADDRDRLGAAAQPPGARRRDHLGRHPDRRRVEPRQLGRPAARFQRQGDRRQLADPDRQLERRGGRQRRHRLRHPRQHRQVVHRRGEGGQAQAADRSAAAAAERPAPGTRARASRIPTARTRARASRSTPTARTRARASRSTPTASRATLRPGSGPAGSLRLRRLAAPRPRRTSSLPPSTGVEPTFDR